MCGFGLFDFASSPSLLHVLVIVFFIWYVKATFFDASRNLPPVPERPMPIFGHMLKLTKDPRQKMKEWRKKCGDLFCYYVGSQLFVVVNGYKLHREIFVKHADAFSDRPDHLISADISDAKKGITTNSGPDWKEQRTVSLLILKSVGLGKNIMAERITEEVSLYLEALAALKEGHNVHELTNSALANVICSIAFGRRFEYDDEFFTRMQHETNERVKLLGKGSFLNVVPWLKYLPGDIFNKKKIDETMERQTSHLSDRFIKEELESDPNEDKELSFISSYLDEMKKRQTSGKHTYLDRSLRRIVLTLFSAGSETTSTTLLWYMVYMVNYPEIQKKVCETIDATIERDRFPALHDRPRLNYVSAVIMETQRRASIIPFSVQHKCSKTVTIQGYTIPEGATVIPNLDSVLLDEKIWGDPKNFRPERFLADDESLLQPDEFIPFSIGWRKCLGEALAKVELFLFVTSLSQRFELLPEFVDNPPVMTPQFGITAPPKPFRIRFKERQAV